MVGHPVTLPADFKSARPISFPCMEVKLVAGELVIANDYNPNRVSEPELALLAHSIAEDGFTQAIVVFHDEEVGRYIVVDGFHRHHVLTCWFGCPQIPVVEIRRGLKERIAATIQHNQARGRHQVDLMAVLIERMHNEGWDEGRIAGEMGMEAEEVLRLEQSIGIAARGGAGRPAPPRRTILCAKDAAGVAVTFPVLRTRFVPMARVTANDYNPNRVEREEMKLLALSIEQSGFTQAVVVFHDAASDAYIVVDGFHRYLLLRNHFKCNYMPVVVIEKDLAERMAATVRHNRARGKHTRAVTERIVERLTALGMSNGQIAKNLGMRAEEVLRLKQPRGIADYYRHRKYSRAWVWVDGAEDEAPEGEGEDGEEMDLRG